MAGISSKTLTYCTGPVLTVSEPQSSGASAGASCAAGHALPSSIWSDRGKLKVYFMNPDKLVEEKWTVGTRHSLLNCENIMGWVDSAWRSDGHSHIPKFEETEFAEKADIRVEFSSDNYTYIGSAAFSEVSDKTKGTMFLNLKGCDLETQKFLVIHEFGHALGLLHEHQRHDFWSVAGTLLSLDKMKRDPRMKKVNFDRDMLETQSVGAVADQKYDPDSVMHYWFDIDWLHKEDHKDLAKVNSDPTLTPEQKKILRGIHKRNKSNPKRPSKQDLDLLESLYCSDSTDNGTPISGAPADHSPTPAPPSAPVPTKYSEYDHVKLTSKQGSLNQLFIASVGAKNEWWYIGSSLGIEAYDLQAIQKQNYYDQQMCYNKMLQKWFEGGYENKNLGHFLRVLASPTVDKDQDFCENVIAAICPKQRSSSHGGPPEAKHRKR